MNSSTFLQLLNLPDEDILQKFNFTCDGRTLSEDEARRFLTFIRTQRSAHQKMR